MTTTRKLDPGLRPDDARAEVRDLASWRPVVIDIDVIESAWALEDAHSLSFWDALIIAAAQVARCDTLLSEDLADGETYGGVTVLSPFTHQPGA